jgi:hypothetical protein
VVGLLLLVWFVVGSPKTKSFRGTTSRIISLPRPIREKSPRPQKEVTLTSPKNQMTQESWEKAPTPDSR